MLSEKEIHQKLQEKADVFRQHVKYKQWPQAKACYDTAVTVAVFLCFEEKQMHELFGERGERGEILSEGMFPENLVQKAYWECIKMHQTYENKQYESPQKNGV